MRRFIEIKKDVAVEKKSRRKAAFPASGRGGGRESEEQGVGTYFL